MNRTKTQKNALVLINKIEKKLRTEKKPEIFPLTATHRKELRQLRNKNVGNLLEQINSVRKMKKEEFIKKYRVQINKELDVYRKQASLLNNNWKSFMDKLIKMLNDRIEMEKDIDYQFLDKSTGYGNISYLNVKEISKETKRIFSVTPRIVERITEKEFEKKYGSAFKIARDKIDKLEELYEEAINFGDLEVVKELYYNMKDADVFIEKISKITI